MREESEDFSFKDMMRMAMMQQQFDIEDCRRESEDCRREETYGVSTTKGSGAMMKGSGAKRIDRTSKWFSRCSEWFLQCSNIGNRIPFLFPSSNQQYKQDSIANRQSCQW
jgi:hypothetical protein